MVQAGHPLPVGLTKARMQTAIASNITQIAAPHLATLRQKTGSKLGRYRLSFMGCILSVVHVKRQNAAGPLRVKRYRNGLSELRPLSPRKRPRRTPVYP